MKPASSASGPPAVMPTSRLSLLLLLALFHLALSESEPGTSEKVWDYCQKKHPADNDTLLKMLGHVEIPEERNATCWLACAMRRIGIIGRGRIGWELLRMQMKAKWTLDEHREMIDKVVEQCKREVQAEDYPDQCDLAYQIMICKKKHGDELGLPHIEH